MLLYSQKSQKQLDVYYCYYEENDTGLPPVPLHQHSPFYTVKVIVIPLKNNRCNVKIKIKKQKNERVFFIKNEELLIAIYLWFGINQWPTRYFKPALLDMSLAKNAETQLYNI